jgi:CRISPR-associated protein Cas1
MPAAFEIAAEGSDDLARQVRERVRVHLYEEKILDRAVHDVQRLLLERADDIPTNDQDRVRLWDERLGEVESGVAYGGAE